MAREYDLVILGGGTGGYVAAIRAAQYGLKVAIVEKDKLGGTCLHRGCIPTKSLLRSAEVYRQTKKALEFGIEIPSYHINYQAVHDRKDAIVQKLHNGIKALMKKGKIDVYYGIGRLLGPSIFSPMAGTISVEMADGTENEMLIPKQVIIATGSSPQTIEGIEIDGEWIINSDHLLELKELPTSITIIGGGVIGIEWASLLNDFGVNVTIIEYRKRLLPTEDEDISKEMEKALKKRGIQLYTNARLNTKTIEKTGDKVKCNIDVNERLVTIEADKMLISVGRKGNWDGIGLENTEIEIDKGFINVNDLYQTKESHIFAIGDVIGGMQLAHVATHQALMVVEYIANRTKEHDSVKHIPKCIYSYPEVASIGLSEQQAIEKGFKIKKSSFPFSAVGKALVFGETDGFVKIIADEQTNDILGVHMIGQNVTEMISEATLSMVLDATPWEIGQTIHAHPTLSETFLEAALAIDGKMIHL